MSERLARAVDWAFRDRRTGRIVLAQAPNLALAVFLGAAIARRALDLEGDVGAVVRVVEVGALLVWAADEVARGVNPFRRALGAVVAAVTLFGLFAAS